jgi:hypothetical protein
MTNVWIDNADGTITLETSDGLWDTLWATAQDVASWHDDTYWIFMAKISDRVRTMVDWSPE